TRQLAYYGLTARIKRLSDTLNAEARAIYAHLDFEIQPNWHLVLLLLKDQELPVTAIANSLGFSHAAIIKITQSMKEKGFISSTPDAQDGRKQILSLTVKSKDLLPRFEKEWYKIQQIVKECSDDGFLESLTHFEKAIAEKGLSQRFKEYHE
ncbi:MAG: MarR family transcriptional regulator, partial [Bacteroidota bacterium]